MEGRNTEENTIVSDLDHLVYIYWINQLTFSTSLDVLNDNLFTVVMWGGKKESRKESFIKSPGTK